MPIKVSPTGLAPSASGPATPVIETPMSACSNRRTPVAIAAAVCPRTAPYRRSVRPATPARRSGSRLLADGPILPQRRLGDAQLILLHSIGIADHAAEKVGRAP